MALKKKKKVYLSFPIDLLDYIDSEAERLNLTRTKLINNIIRGDYEKNRKKLIEKIIEGKKIRCENAPYL